MKIICGTDFTEHAARGTTVAAALAGKLQDKLLLIHALPGGGQGVGFPEVMNSLFASLHEMLAEDVARLGRFGVEVEPHLITAYPEQAILDKVVPAETRLVVMASRGRAVSNHGLVGSVAERVAESAPVPTLVVRQDEPFLQWAQGQRPLKVMCAYDFSATADAALAYLNELRRWGPCDVAVAQVDSPLDEKARLGLGGPTPFDGNEPEVQRILERDLREKVNAVLGHADNGSVRLRVKGAWGRPDYDLIAMANEEQADLLVTGTHQRHGLERLFQLSVSRALLRYAPMSVLVVPGQRHQVQTPPANPRRVLAATDFSEAGDEAVRHAYSLLGAGGTVHLVHVIHPQALPGGQYEHGVGNRHTHEQHAEHVRACADRLRALVPAEAAQRGIVTEVEVLEHRAPAAAIAQAAERFGADLICMGTHGVARVLTALSGSVAQTVMNRSHRPLLVVHAATT